MKLKTLINFILLKLSSVLKALLGWGIFIAVAVGQPASIMVMTLGITQDGGYPQAGCSKTCCLRPKQDPTLRRYRASLAIVDESTRQYWIIDATPDLPEQFELLHTRISTDYQLAGVLLTHAHIGHYTGLMYFGREAMGSKYIPVYCMPRMKSFLEQNGPWSQLVQLQNITLIQLEPEHTIALNDKIQIVPLPVPHRDEYSETVAFRILINGQHQIFYLPDIDKWEKWPIEVNKVIKEADLAILDGCFYDEQELPGRDIREVPHPLIKESLSRFNTLANTHKHKIYFTHFNHTNPVLNPNSQEYQQVRKQGIGILEQGQVFIFR